MVGEERVVPQTLAEIVEEHGGAPELLASLYEREEFLRDYLTGTAIQYGLYPEIVAFHVARFGVGPPIDDATKQIISDNYTNLINRLRQSGAGN